MCPDLVDAVAGTDADVVACYPYLFATTVDAIAVSRVPTVLHPAAHDEPALYFSAFRRASGDVDGFVYHTQAERDLMEYVFGIGARPQIVLGLGVNDAAGAGRPGGEHPRPRGPALPLLPRPGRRAQGMRDAGRVLRPSTRSGARRISPSPSSGRCPTKAPDHPDIVVTGTVSEADKWDILAGARVMVTPSAYESFSLVRAGGVDARGARAGQRVLRGHHGALPAVGRADCGSTRTGRSRDGRPVARRRRPRAPPRVRRGATYTARYYRWPSIIDRYTGFLDGVVARGRRPAIGRHRLAQPAGARSTFGR